MTAVATPTAKRPPRRYVAPCPSCGSTDRRRYNVEPIAGVTGRAAATETMRRVDCRGCGANLHTFPARIAKPAPGSPTGTGR